MNLEDKKKKKNTQFNIEFTTVSKRRKKNCKAEKIFE